MKTFLIINGGRQGPPGEALLRGLSECVDLAGPGGRVAVSTSVAHARELVAEAAAGGFEALWMGGGDGTVNVLLNAALEARCPDGRPPDWALGVVPMGTVNALARALRLPLKPVPAARALATATPRRYDLGRVNGRHFLCFASVGFDAAVVHDVGVGKLKRVYGKFAYVAAGIAALARLDRIAPFNIEFDDPVMTPAPDSRSRSKSRWKAVPAVAGPLETVEHPALPSPLRQHGRSLVVSNISNYAGLDLFRHVTPDSGSMEAWLVRRRRPDFLTAWVAGLAAGRLPGGALLRRLARPAVGHYIVKGFRVDSPEPLFLQVDGEAVELPPDETRALRFECLPAAARVLVPA